MNYTLIMNVVIGSSIMAALLVILIFIVKFIFYKKISAKWQYAIWFLLLLRLLVPYIGYSPLNLSNMLLAASTYITEARDIQRDPVQDAVKQTD
jgi:beta-lactamase regulating signal transducer with metallopeptidase domain